MSSDRLSSGRNSLLFTILFLFFFQLIADFVEAIYAFGLLSTSIPAEIVAVLFFFSPVVLFAFRRGFSHRGLWLAAGIVLLSRLLEVRLDTRGRMLVSGVGVAAFLVFLPALLSTPRREKAEPLSLQLGIGLTFALSLSVLFRALNSGSDLSTYNGFQIIGWMLALLAAGLMWTSGMRTYPKGDTAPQGESTTPKAGEVIAFSLGIAAGLLLLYFAFSAPNVIARWTGVSYLLILFLLTLSLSAFAFLLQSNHLPPSRNVLLLWNVVFVLSLLFTILPHQIRFPADQRAYPLLEPPVNPLWTLPLILLLLTFPVILLDFMLFTRALFAQNLSPRRLAVGFSLASLFILLLVFGQVFTTVYDYIPVVGPYFRDKFWLVFLILGVVLVLPAFRLGGGELRFEAIPAGVGGGVPLWGVAGLIGVVALGGAYARGAKPIPPAEGADSLRILTYNIQQGYDEAGLKNFDGQLALIRSLDPDIIGLQESDTNRIAGGNSDVVRYFADRLNMYAYYGPKTVPGTFGIALLSRYPIANPRTYYLYSIGEQTAAIEAQITLAGKTFNVYVTHLGNGGPIFQQQEFLQILQGKENIIAMGDFNFRPDSEQYRLTTQRLIDSWAARWPQGVPPTDFDSTRRIDHIFLSPGIPVRDSRFITDPQSDHPALLTEIALP